MRKPLFAVFAAILFLSPLGLIAQTNTTDESVVWLFGRDDCGFCKAEFAWLEEEGIDYDYYNIVKDDDAKDLYNQITEKHGITKVTPVTVIGERVIVGFNGAETTGTRILEAIEAAKDSDIRSLEEHIAQAPKQDAVSGAGCSDLECSLGTESAFVFDLPLVGVVDLKPCAMWVLITFLVLLSQAGSKRKMVFLAGLFILAEGIMYNLILNVWYKTWDFVALDQIVTPLVGFLALGGGLFFLWRWQKNRNQPLVCDISDIESQQKTVSKFQAVVNQPVTLATIGSILIIAFSVNIIEFACSIGIPQAYTKILDLNLLTFLERQWYILVYTIGYMIDDLIVFALAIWGYSKLQSHGAKYSQLSLLIGGALMVLLGAILVFDPSVLVL